jgi:hypothetical protein
LRTASLIFALISLYAAYFLGKRFVRNPLAAASLLAITPAFWLTSYSLLIDSALLAFFLAALWCFIEGHEQKSSKLLIGSGVLMGCALLTKYTGFLIVPVVTAWQIWYRDKASWRGTILALAVCGAIFLLWGIWGICTYGQMHFIATLPRGFHTASLQGGVCLALFALGVYVRRQLKPRPRAIQLSWLCWIPACFLVMRAFWLMPSFGDWLQAFYFDKGISVASFLGGCTVFLFFTPFLLWKKNKQAFSAWVLGGILLLALFVSRVGGFDLLQSAMLAYFIGSTIAFGLLWAMGMPSFQGIKAQLLWVWLGLGFLELILVMPWTAGRYLVLILPPVCWVFRKSIEESGRYKLWNAAWGATALLGLALAYVDYAQAGVILPLSRVLADNNVLFQQIAPRPPHHWYYLADTFDGSQPYVLRLGWENVFPNQQFESGSLFLRSYYRKSSWWKLSDPQRFQPTMAWEFNNWLPLRVMDIPASAGFYASCWGSLPYAITRHPLELFELYLVK